MDIGVWTRLALLETWLRPYHHLDGHHDLISISFLQFLPNKGCLAESKYLCKDGKLQVPRSKTPSE
jgi:hypothetical protein